ncbi:hypothetical protein F5144DRAFT_563559 [Chaetomium tenue]|uniref:Uncharacterized protein n=1 Tax=Chaetomium tenue TaxID=1854479 RepID=A0ACB7PHX4_9PEZI|nr:hypothetical protein F5144DRAFT_563559 [Chaetomium globosum]
MPAVVGAVGAVVVVVVPVVVVVLGEDLGAAGFVERSSSVSDGLTREGCCGLCGGGGGRGGWCLVLDGRVWASRMELLSRAGASE